MRMRAPKEGSYEPLAPLDLPHSLHAFQRVPAADEMNQVLTFSILLIYEQKANLRERER